MEDDVRVYTVIPNFLLCTAFMVYAFLHGNDLLKLPSVIKRFVLMYFGLFFYLSFLIFLYLIKILYPLLQLLDNAFRFYLFIHHF